MASQSRCQGWIFKESEWPAEPGLLPAWLVATLTAAMTDLPTVDRP